jgi:SAM-dependent methyltransferase
MLNSILSQLYSRLSLDKYRSELAYWRIRHILEGGRFRNDHFRRLMLGMAEETNDDFLKDKCVADFGCGPRGSLEWIRQPCRKIGLDVLAERYQTLFRQDIQSHAMDYIPTSETEIPVASASIGVLFSINALDHVKHLDIMAKEILRILKPGGLFIASINLNQPPTPTEPWTLTEELMQGLFLDSLDVQSFRTARRGPKGDAYRYFFDPDGSKEQNPDYLWIKAVKPVTVRTTCPAPVAVRA